MIDIEKMKQAALEALDNMDDYARMEASIEPIGALNHLTDFINTVCARLEAAENERDTHRAERKILSEAFAEQLTKLTAAEQDAAKWQAYQKRKQEVIAAGLGRKIMRDLESHDALPAFYEAMKESKK